MKNYKDHYNIRSQLLIEANKIQGVKLWPNPQGYGFLGTVVNSFTRNGDRYTLLKNARPVKFGLTPGSSDTIGFKVEDKRPIFLAPEVKAGNDVLRPNQENFINMVNNYGGIAGVVRRFDDFISLINRRL